MEVPKPKSAILAIGTAVPAFGATQAQVGEWMAASLAARPTQARVVRALCANSGIETRYACINDYELPPEESRFSLGVTADRCPSTAERMAIYAREAPPLGAKAARRSIAALARKQGISPTAITQQVTHLVVASCTGFYAPGLDIALARALELSATVERSLIGFMGCSALFNCWRVADYIVRANPDALVLVVSVELSSLHSQPEITIDRLIGASLFADGASACLVGKADDAMGDTFIFEGFHTDIKPDTETEMAWQIGNRGFVLQLSPRVPDHLAEAAPAALAELFGPMRPQFWAIHPGGSAIIQRLGKIFGCSDQELAASRAVLRDYGNLSSATILFVVDEMRRQLAAPHARMENGADTKKEYHPNGDPHPREGVAMAFGPGLVIEMARMVYVPPIDIQASISKSISPSISTSVSTKGQNAERQLAHDLGPRPEGRDGRI